VSAQHQIGPPRQSKSGFTQTLPSAQYFRRVTEPGGLRVYALLHCLFFALYATLGRGFAYIGSAPVYLGEILLCAGIWAALVSRRIGMILRTPIGIALLCFFLWHMSCSAPYLSTYGVNTLRDSAAWGYSLFGVIIAALVVRFRNALSELVKHYRRFSVLYIFVGPASAALTWYWPDALPVLPGTQVTMPYLKAGDLCVHLGGISAFLLGGVSSGRQWLFLGVAVGAIIGGVINRGGLLALIAATCLVLALRARLNRMYFAVLALVFIGGCLLVIDPHISIPGTQRELSAVQVLRNITSIGSAEAGEDLGSTRRWRLEWWAKIYDYTVDGPYFWAGKGYGVNLAYSDGIDARSDAPLRSPHNSHLTFLARGGVPGFLLWLLLQVTWFLTIFRGYIRARAAKQQQWAALFAWLLAYWLAFCVNACFDVSLEGPMSAIPFWTVFGVGWGAHCVFAKRRTGNPFAPRFAISPWTQRVRPAEA
jgi:hypothetical protein